MSIHYSSSCTLSINRKYISAWSILCTKNNETNITKTLALSIQKTFSRFITGFILPLPRVHTRLYFYPRKITLHQSRVDSPDIETPHFKMTSRRIRRFPFSTCVSPCVVSIAIWEFLRKRNTAAFTSDEVRLSSRKSLKFTSLVCTSLSLFHRVIRDEVLS